MLRAETEPRAGTSRPLQLLTQPSVRVALTGAATTAALLVLTWFAAVHIPLGRRWDTSILRGFVDLGNHFHTGAVALWIAQLCNPKPYVYLCAIPICIAFARRRLWLVVAISAVLLGANVSTHLLKPLLGVSRAAPGLHALHDSWPSGHATAAMSLALASVLALPRRLRPSGVVVGAVFTVAVSYSFLSLDWHYPSDVLGGFLMALTWTLVAVAGLAAADARRGPAADQDAAPGLSPREVLRPPALALACAASLFGLVFLARPHLVVSYAHAHRGFVLGTIALFVVALAAGTAVVAALSARRPGRRE